MAKKFKFNHETLGFEEVKHSLGKLLSLGVRYAVLAALFLVIYYYFFSKVASTPQERELAQINETLKSNLEVLQTRSVELEQVVGDMKERDVKIYRRVFESDPPAWQAETGVRTNNASLEQDDNAKLTKQTREGITALSTLVKQQTQLQGSIIAKAQRQPSAHLSALPSIQPVLNSDLRRTAATYGMRFHPFYKVLKMHPGMDFAAPVGEPVLATANGKVESVNLSQRQAGLHITIDHGNGYKTVYAHLHQALVKTGTTVKRGQQIAMVGNSGRSLAPHLHYEVWKNNALVNPIHYYYSDLTPEKYSKLLDIAANKGQSLD